MAIITFFVGRRFLLRVLLSSLLTPVIYLVTHTVFFIYQECNGKNTVSDILSKLCENYDIDGKTAKKDLLIVINSLINETSVKI